MNHRPNDGWILVSVPLPRLYLKLLGQTSVRIGDVDVTERIRPKSLSLLKVLAGSPQRSLSKEAIADMLWPDSLPDAAFLSLKVTAHYLRRALECESGEARNWVIMRHGVYALGEDVTLDADEFERCVRDAMAHEAAGQTGEASLAFGRAVALYGGDYLPDDVYEDWALMTRERLRDQYLYALERVAAEAMEAHNYMRAIDCAHRIVQLDPCREDIYCLLIRAHGAMGQLARARAWYGVAQRTMHAEVDRDVSTRTKRAWADARAATTRSAAVRGLVVGLIGGLSALAATGPAGAALAAIGLLN